MYDIEKHNLISNHRPQKRMLIYKIEEKLEKRRRNENDK
jgi:hypothetical protein